MDRVDLSASTNSVPPAAAEIVCKACQFVRSVRATPSWLKARDKRFVIETKQPVLKKKAAQKKLFDSLATLGHNVRQDQAYALQSAQEGHRLLVSQPKGTIVVASQAFEAGQALAAYFGEVCTLQEALGRDSSAHQWYQAGVVLPSGDELVIDATYHRCDIAEVCDVRVLGLVEPGDRSIRCSPSSRGMDVQGLVQPGDSGEPTAHLDRPLVNRPGKPHGLGVGTPSMPFGSLVAGPSCMPMCMPMCKIPQDTTSVGNHHVSILATSLPSGSTPCKGLTTSHTQQPPGCSPGQLLLTNRKAGFGVPASDPTAKPQQGPCASAEV
eukprot:GHUV01017638.1.p1 GENE.GHUV01017638.1~~GHUV01017638.1.p1  ORF type:complete len:324 (-),score=38.87 GHUV01017638.1:385-1356(-)